MVAAGLAAVRGWLPGRAALAPHVAEPALGAAGRAALDRRPRPDEGARGVGMAPIVPVAGVIPADPARRVPG